MADKLHAGVTCIEYKRASHAVCSRKQVDGDGAATDGVERGCGVRCSLQPIRVLRLDPQLSFIGRRDSLACPVSGKDRSAFATVAYLTLQERMTESQAIAAIETRVDTDGWPTQNLPRWGWWAMRKDTDSDATA